ncbi:TPA: MarR family transcriptional regulator [Escherichia coli]|uniref:MarR family transcriptional regulator n=1 Tax=Klebsiella pneumoniae complex TaxID=3390273 RepID=UPI001B9A3305|nr:helix-turn-helix domain-containing protein [Klebsiella pneumoniae]HAV8936677.1 MarR family transcriptional regulator [Escherichia coli]MBR8554504.1 MarR family transcriptional regulator [Klebsiella pneumoniae]HAV9253662.1 MarR family transcriptional regulator [Escherichia coli]HAW0316883.1 MarR family transcriptional regulator [Escherichia coli]HAW1123304.1 MarR family transcriptional regulator [Escherichia coli]
MFDNLNAGMTPNQVKALAYLMTRKYGATQARAAAFFGVTQSTISQWVKEAAFMIQINQLQQELQYAEQRISQLMPPSN